MRRVLVIAVTGVVLAVGLWTVGSLFVMRNVKTPEYEVISTAAEYELRRYPDLLVAETRGQAGTGGNGLFPVLAGFIFGGNEASDEIAMTAPVLMAGTAAASNSPHEPAMQFIMPGEFTMETLPKPVDGRVILREVPTRVLAARRFGWFASAGTRESQLESLLGALRRDGIAVVGEPVYAAYQPPFSVPFLKRHEMLVEVETAGGA